MKPCAPWRGLFRSIGLAGLLLAAAPDRPEHLAGSMPELALLSARRSPAAGSCERILAEKYPVRPSVELFLTRSMAILALAVALAAFFVSVYSLSREILARALFGVAGVAFLLVARYYWKLTPESLRSVEDQPWFGGAFIHHRSDLERTARVACVVTLCCLAAFCFGNEWPVRIAFWPLLIGSLVLFRIARNSASHGAGSEQDWMRVPAPIRVVLERSKTLLTVLFFVAALLKIWSLKSPEHGNTYRLAAIVAGGDVAFMFALEALFFRYGDLRSVPEHELRDA